MSLIGKKVQFRIPEQKDGENVTAKEEIIEGEVVEKYYAEYPIPSQTGLSVLGYDNYLVKKENGDLVAVSPSFATKLLK